MWRVRKIHARHNRAVEFVIGEIQDYHERLKIYYLDQAHDCDLKYFYVHLNNKHKLNAPPLLYREVDNFCWEWDTCACALYERRVASTHPENIRTVLLLYTLTEILDGFSLCSNGTVRSSYQ
jgi:hypothetical protein